MKQVSVLCVYGELVEITCAEFIEVLVVSVSNYHKSVTFWNMIRISQDCDLLMCGVYDYDLSHKYSLCHIIALIC